MGEFVSERVAPQVEVRRPKAILGASPPFVSFAMPAYNEEKVIEKTIVECQEALKSSGLAVYPSSGEVRWGEIVVTDDCSKDSTPIILARLQETMPNLVVVTHLDKNQGYGRTLWDAIAATRGEWVATLDSDGQFDPADLVKFLELVRKAGGEIDCIAGYREKKRDTLVRVIADRGLNLLVKAMFGIRHRDTNCAFKLVRGEIIRNLIIESRSFQTPTEIVLKLHAMGYKMMEVGVSHRGRGEGKSKLKVVKTSLDFFRFLLYLRTKINLYKKGILMRL